MKYRDILEKIPNRKAEKFFFILCLISVFSSVYFFFAAINYLSMLHMFACVCSYFATIILFNTISMLNEIHSGRYVETILKDRIKQLQ